MAVRLHDEAGRSGLGEADLRIRGTLALDAADNIEVEARGSRADADIAGLGQYEARPDACRHVINAEGAIVGADLLAVLLRDRSGLLEVELWERRRLRLDTAEYIEVKCRVRRADADITGVLADDGIADG